MYAIVATELVGCVSTSNPIWAASLHDGDAGSVLSYRQATIYSVFISYFNATVVAKQSSPVYRQHGTMVWRPCKRASVAMATTDV